MGEEVFCRGTARRALAKKWDILGQAQGPAPTQSLHNDAVAWNYNIRTAPLSAEAAKRA